MNWHEILSHTDLFPISAKTTFCAPCLLHLRFNWGLCFGRMCTASYILLYVGTNIVLGERQKQDDTKFFGLRISFWSIYVMLLLLLLVQFNLCRCSSSLFIGSSRLLVSPVLLAMFCTLLSTVKLNIWGSAVLFGITSEKGDHKINCQTETILLICPLCIKQLPTTTRRAPDHIVSKLIKVKLTTLCVTASERRSK